MAGLTSVSSKTGPQTLNIPPTSSVIVWLIPQKFLTTNKGIEWTLSRPICLSTTKSQIIAKCSTSQDNNQFLSTITWKNINYKNPFSQEKIKRTQDKINVKTHDKIKEFKIYIAITKNQI